MKMKIFPLFIFISAVKSFITHKIMLRRTMVNIKPLSGYIKNKNIIYVSCFRSGLTTLIQDGNVPDKISQKYHENELNDIIKMHILGHKTKRKIFAEVANGSDILQLFDSFNPLYSIILLVSCVLSLNDDKRNGQILKIQNNSPDLNYRWFDFCLLLIVFTFMRNVQNAL